MLRAANEIQIQTREAIEGYIMEKIEEASRNGNSDIQVGSVHAPTWLLEKLLDYGYKVEDINENTCCISWGVDGIC